MKVLVACEFSGVVRDAFAARGHDAWSCDILPCPKGGQHIQKDVFAVLDRGWDLMIAHPPCTHLCVSGAKHFHKVEKRLSQIGALDFFRALLEAPIEKIAVENPVGIASTRIRPPDQIVQPYWFGDPQRKTTCLWLKNLPPLVPTNKVEPHLMTVNGKRLPVWMKERGAYGDVKVGLRRSITFPGLAAAMAQQWG